ncbi:Uncharacterized protein Rs2_15806 [Raphanus sativus]|nr:Uncharacterized protein Rs2_15806 [Raphanus sativus]
MSKLTKQEAAIRVTPFNFTLNHRTFTVSTITEDSPMLNHVKEHVEVISTSSEDKVGLARSSSGPPNLGGKIGAECALANPPENAEAQKKRKRGNVVGEIKSVKGYGLTDDEVTSPIFIRFLIAPTMEVNLCLLDNTAAVFKCLLNTGDRTHSVMVVTSVNPKKIGGGLYLITTAPTKLFSGLDLYATTEFTRSISNTVGQNIPSLPAGRMITSEQISSIGDLNMFLSNSTAQEAYFISKARIVEVLGQNGWYYVSCSRCGIKLHNSAAALPCNHCLDTNARGVEMLNLTKQVAATTLHDEVNHGVCNKLPPPLAALQSKVFVFHVVLTPNIITTNSPTFTVLGISDTTNPEPFTINDTKHVQLAYGEASTSVSNTLTDEVEGGESKISNISNIPALARGLRH